MYKSLKSLMGNRKEIDIFFLKYSKGFCQLTCLTNVKTLSSMNFIFCSGDIQQSEESLSFSYWHVVAFQNNPIKHQIWLICISIASPIAFSQQVGIAQQMPTEPDNVCCKQIGMIYAWQIKLEICSHCLFFLKFEFTKGRQQPQNQAALMVDYILNLNQFI